MNYNRNLIICCWGVILAILFGGCGSTKVISGDVQNKDLMLNETDETTTETDNSNDKLLNINEVQNNDDGYKFIYQGIEIKIDAKAAAIVEQLGEPLSYFEAPSCAFNGIDKMYTYSGFELDTYPDNDCDYVSAVLFKDDSIATPEGVSIGDTIEKMRQVYGEYSSEDQNLAIYPNGNMKLCFVLENGVITSIEYKSTVLD